MIGFLIALACLLAGMILLGVMRRRHKETRRLRVERQVLDSSPTSLDAWRSQANASLQASRARRGLEMPEGSDKDGSAA